MLCRKMKRLPHNGHSKIGPGHCTQEALREVRSRIYQAIHMELGPKLQAPVPLLGQDMPHIPSAAFVIKQAPSLLSLPR